MSVTLAYIGYVMIAVLMAIIITKKLSPFAALTIVPLIFGGVACVVNGVGVLEMGSYVKDSIVNLAGTITMVLFAITYFGIMISSGLFDALVRKIVQMTKGNPCRVMVGAAVMSACVALDGEGSTTYIICCTAMLPVFERLKMNKLYLAVVIIMNTTVLNLMPWGGPSARIMVSCNMDANEILRYLAPGIVLAVLYTIGIAYYLGLKERKRLGIMELCEIELEETAQEVENQQYKRPNLVWFNLILTIMIMVSLITGWLSANVAFAIGTAVALVVNYHKVSDQAHMISTHGAQAIPVVAMIIGASVLVGVMDGTGMSDAIAVHLSSLVPESLGGIFPILLSVISCLGAFFLSVDAFYYGVLPILAEAGYAFGFSNITMGVAASMGQAFHMISPLVGSFYLIVQLTGQSMTDVQKNVAKWAVGMFLCFALGGVISGVYPG